MMFKIRRNLYPISKSIQTAHTNVHEALFNFPELAVFTLPLDLNTVTAFESQIQCFRKSLELGCLLTG